MPENESKPALSPGASWILQEIKTQKISVLEFCRQTHLSLTAVKGWKKGAVPRTKAILKAAAYFQKSPPPELLSSQQAEKDLKEKIPRIWVYDEPSRKNSCRGCEWVRDGSHFCLLPRCMKGD